MAYLLVIASWHLKCTLDSRCFFFLFTVSAFKEGGKEGREGGLGRDFEEKSTTIRMSFQKARKN